MPKHNIANERIKREYFGYLREAKRRSEKTVDQIAAAIAAFEASTGHKDFKRFHIEQAKSFKRRLETEPGENGRPLALATIRSRLMALKAFFQWLAGRHGYRRLSYADAEYFNLPARENRIARITREKPVPTLAQIRDVLKTMPNGTDIEKRDRAVIAFAIVSGARDRAIASFKLKHVDVQARIIDHDAREVDTKNAKSIRTIFFPVGDDIEAVVTDWIAHLKTNLHCGPNDPLFPKTRIIVGKDDSFVTDGLTRDHWASAQPIRDILKRGFAAAELPYFNPHSFRSTIVLLGEVICPSREQFKAWSQNLGHEHEATTLISYGTVPSRRQAEILNQLRRRSSINEEGEYDAETIRRVFAQVAKSMER